MRKSKLISLLSIIVILMMCMCSCGAQINSSLVGEWSCGKEDSTNSIYTGCYVLIIGENGDFDMYDEEAGNPGIAGKITECDGEEDGTITVKFGTDDFDPPATWELDETDTLQYQVINDESFKLGYNDSWLTFNKR